MFLGCFSIHTHPTPPLTPQTMLDPCIQNFSEIQLCIGWGEGELQENFENDAVFRGSREMMGKYAYCSTVPRTFVQDCNHGQKSWDTFALLGCFSIHLGPTPPLTPQTMLDACIQNFFRDSTLYRVGGGRTARKFRK